ncbi:NADP-dependent phosphogluconate dehydrogenase [Mesorhizobium sp. RP14(2022)]|uniref:6-phosphogluconate dehydrogenase, decarboxylating n=1 Tax=Mesorhizobium liriopis TaxID=2953882 RepID=A0ABT1C4Q7_9HYPH|nr:NADP-dependent phosphogluconate dehydrogenase [Mesorhizobium liriopis]MCO6048936.1 NADP-dependent phosphogluconate dehydrogenase [Mesorhizobium liriopis]
MELAEIGLVGLGVMGSNLALNIAEHGHRIAVWNRELPRLPEFIRDAGDLAQHIIPTETIEQLIAAIKPPRAVILMIPAGAAVDEQIGILKPLLGEGGLIIDAGNSDFRDTVRRVKELEGSGVTLVGMGVSGGEEGARHGPSMMAGGERSAFARIERIIMDIAARTKDGEPCAAWLGPDGAGHFVKTIHNGIEYADMQMIAEIYGAFRDGAGLKPAETAEIFKDWNTRELDSYLIEITARVLSAVDKETEKPIVDIILDRAGQKGTGLWSAVEAERLGRPASVIEAAVGARVLSSLKDEREAAEKAYGLGKPEAGAFTKNDAQLLEHALLAGKVVAYAQGFAVLAMASRMFDWNLPLPTVARIWRAGCIIRSQFLGTIAAAFEGPKVDNLLMTPAFIDIMKRSHGALREVVARAAQAGLPMPALSSALAYFDSYRQGRGTTDLIQAQRDFFGAHGFERIDQPGAHHGIWGISEMPATPTPGEKA